MGVKIEMFRMVLYLSFPVTMFWISNQAEYFEEYIVKRKIFSISPLCLSVIYHVCNLQREIFPPDEKMHRKELEEFKERMRNRKEKRLLKEMALESQN